MCRRQESVAAPVTPREPGKADKTALGTLHFESRTLPAIYTTLLGILTKSLVSTKRFRVE